MTLVQEFKAFVARGNVTELAVAVVLGGAFGKIVTAFVNGLIMPLVSYVLPKGDWQTFTLGKFQVGAVAGAVVDFALIALVVFLVFVKGLAAVSRKREEAPAPATRACPRCLEQVPLAATRCRCCTSELAPETVG
ncbi:MAG: large conductance mechanosensitive channel protein MscL [Holophaga sp.]|jgi:large conductance mechanosensitive channel